MRAWGRKAFVADIAAKHGRRLRRYLAVRLRNATDVADLAQEVFLRLLRVDRHDKIRSPESYLFTIASHGCVAGSLRMRPVALLVLLRRDEHPPREDAQRFPGGERPGNFVDDGRQCLQVSNDGFEVGIIQMREFRPRHHRR